MTVIEELDKLIAALDGAAAKTEAAGGDAIDRVLAGAPRGTAVRSLRQDEVIRRFRQEVADGLIRVDTVGKVLNLVTQVVTHLLAGGA